MWQGKSSIEPQDHEGLGFFLILNNYLQLSFGMAV